MAVLSAFADEISADLEEQTQTLAECSIGFIDLRGVWNKGVMDLSEEELRRIKEHVDSRGIGIAAIGSPIGKSPIDKPASYEMERLERACRAAELMEARYIRVFSFYPPEDGSQKSVVPFRDEVLRRMAGWVEWVAAHHPSLVLVHENESAIYGDIPSRCLEILQEFNGPNFTGCYDPANFVHEGVERPFQEAWTPLKPYIGYFHLKDYKRGEHPVPCGEGDGEVPAILADARAAGFAGFMTLEPHLAQAGQFRGFSGPQLFKKAVDAVVKICADADMPLTRERPA